LLCEKELELHSYALLARQAIFDRNRKLYAYELLYRSPSGDQPDLDTATGTVISNACLAIGEQHLLRGKHCFVNFGRSALLARQYELLRPTNTVIELLEGTEADDDVIAECRNLKRSGFTIALDDFQHETPPERFLPFASIIKVDFRTTSREEQAAIARRYRPKGMRMLAEKVETWEEYRSAAAIGYDLFQGFFFHKPEVIKCTKPDLLPQTRLRLLCELQSSGLDFLRLSQTIKRDSALVYALLRYVNSAAFAHRAEITHIGQALVLLGEDGVRRLLKLAILQTFREHALQPTVSAATIRGAMCERLLAATGLEGLAEEGFLVGVMSLVDALLACPLEKALEDLPLNSSARRVIEGVETETPLAFSLEVAKACEAGDWPRVDQLARALGLKPAQIASAYTTALQWASEMEEIGNALGSLKPTYAASCLS